MNHARFWGLFARLCLAVTPVPLLAIGCGSDHDGAGQEVASTGTLTLPLVTTSNGHTYRLGGYIYYYGPEYGQIYLGDETELKVTLPTGDYVAYLGYYYLERLDDDGNFVPVSANLVSSYQQPFTIYNRATSTISFQFETDGVIVTVGSGNLVVDVTVTEVPPVCTILGDDCFDGAWCAPPELTGQPLTCVYSGYLEPGEDCLSPLDCVANTSCFDFGGGPVCAALCDKSEFDAPCAGGGTCLAQGNDYGVCIPDGGTPPDGGGFGGEGGIGGSGPGGTGGTGGGGRGGKGGTGGFAGEG